MARPKTIDDAKLLAVARQVFVRAGASGSTKEIAKKAGVSEALLFRRYRTKRALFLAAMIPPKVDAAEMIREASRGRRPRECLVLIAERVLEYFRSAAPLMSVIAMHPLIGPDIPRKELRQDPVHELRQAILFYLLGEAKYRRVSRPSCEAAATLLVSSLRSIALFETMSPRDQTSPRIDVKSLVEALWCGLRPEHSTSSRSRRVTTGPKLPGFD
jgi:AcrR family transcriptional regulator